MRQINALSQTYIISATNRYFPSHKTHKLLLSFQKTVMHHLASGLLEPVAFMLFLMLARASEKLLTSPYLNMNSQQESLVEFSTYKYVTTSILQLVLSKASSEGITRIT